MEEFSLINASFGEIIDPSTVEVQKLQNTYHIEYITSGQCFSQHIESLYVNPLDDPSFVNDFCEGAPNSIFNKKWRFFFNQCLHQVR